MFAAAGLLTAFSQLVSARLARRLGLHAAMTGIPHQWSPAVTGVNLILKTRPKLYDIDHPSLPIPLRRPTGEQDYLWQRAPMRDEAARRYAMMIDARAAHLGSGSSLLLGYGEPTHYDFGDGIKLLLGYLECIDLFCHNLLGHSFLLREILSFMKNIGGHPGQGARLLLGLCRTQIHREITQ